MQTTVLRRVLAGMLAAWFALVSADQSWLHACPMHDGVTATAPGADAQPAAHHAHDSEHSGHGGDQAPHACTCLGACAATTGVAVLGAPSVSLPIARMLVVGIVAPVGQAVAAGTRHPFVLPFATAPPRASLG